MFLIGSSFLTFSFLRLDLSDFWEAFWRPGGTFGRSLGLLGKGSNFRCLLAGHRDPQDLRQCGPVRVKGLSPGPATSYQQSGDWGLQDSSPADSRTGGLEDWYLSRLEDWKDLTLDSELKSLAAWWPSPEGPADVAVYHLFGVTCWGHIFLFISARGPNLPTEDLNRLRSRTRVQTFICF